MGKDIGKTEGSGKKGSNNEEGWENRFRPSGLEFCLWGEGGGAFLWLPVVTEYSRRLTVKQNHRFCGCQFVTEYSRRLTVKQNHR